MKPVVIGVAGGTGSGKTTVVRTLVAEVGPDNVLVIEHDRYYRDRSRLSAAERESVNYDHPDSLETSLLVDHLRRLGGGEAVEIPLYDFATHTRRSKPSRAEPRPVVIVEGILILWDAPLRERMDIRIFVDTDDDVRLIRRLRRDIEERGRTLDSVIRQYLKTVKPMHLEFVEPSKRYADLILPEGGKNRIAIDVLLAKLRTFL